MIYLPKISTSVFLIMGICLLTITSCKTEQTKLSKKEHTQQINSWHQERITSLKEEDSWLTLAGLYSLDDGTQTFGSDSANDIIFPPQAAAQIGSITKQDSSFAIRVKEGVKVLHNDSEISELETNLSEEPNILQHKSLLWNIIERRGTFYIRLKDKKHPNLLAFNGIDRFPVTRHWRIKASFVLFDQPQSITIPDILGDAYSESLYGILEFSVDGKKYSLAPLGDPYKDDELFIVFGDATNGKNSYSGGRYVYIPIPNENGITYIDFNKAYNPPCVFTDFATCPLPPTQNRLNLKIDAGEKMYKK